MENEAANRGKMDPKQQPYHLTGTETVLNHGHGCQDYFGTMTRQTGHNLVPKESNLSQQDGLFQGSTEADVAADAHIAAWMIVMAAAMDFAATAIATGAAVVAVVVIAVEVVVVVAADMITTCVATSSFDAADAVVVDAKSSNN
jgi:hypothetical protein